MDEGCRHTCSQRNSVENETAFVREPVISSIDDVLSTYCTYRAKRRA
jgi:hypothetical protein